MTVSNNASPVKEASKEQTNPRFDHVTHTQRAVGLLPDPLAPQDTHCSADNRRVKSIAFILSLNIKFKKGTIGV